MKKIKILLLSLASSLGGFATDIEVTPGQLEGKLAETKGQNELKINGSIDARDLAALENLSSDVKKLDLSGVKIEALSMPTRKYFGRTLFSEGEIPAYTFFKSGVTTLILPADVTAICDGAFAGSSITEITIPEGITSLGDYAFYGCPNLTQVNLPSSLRSIGKGTFGNCLALQSLDLSNTAITELPERAFAGSLELADITLPPAINKVGREAFAFTAIKSLSLGNVTEFDEYALSSMPYLEALSINPEARMREGLLMDDTSLSSLTGVPEMVPDYFASNCRGLSAEALTKGSDLGRFSFANTLAPEVLYLPAYLTSISQGALSGLDGIVKVDVTALEDRIPAVDDSSFEGLDQGSIILWVDDDAFQLWENDPVWSLFKVMSTSQTGVDDIKAEPASAISISALNGFLVIESPAVVNDVRIYTTDGRMAYVASPWQNRVEIDTASLPSGIVVVAVSDEEGNSKTASILLR